MHEEQVDVPDVVDEERLVAGRHHVARLLVGAVSDLGHGDGAAETPPHTRVDTLRLAPAGVDTHEPVTLVTEEALSACYQSISRLLFKHPSSVDRPSQLEELIVS